MKIINGCMVGLVWMLTAFLAPGALAALPEAAYEEARRTASLHVQIAVTSAKGNRSPASVCSVAGEVVTIFRDKKGNMNVGDRVEFRTDCHEGEIPPPGGGSVEATRLMSAKYLEVYLDPIKGTRYAVARWQLLIIGAPSAEPELPVEGPWRY